MSDRVSISVSLVELPVEIRLRIFRSLLLDGDYHNYIDDDDNDNNNNEEPCDDDTDGDDGNNGDGNDMKNTSNPRTKTRFDSHGLSPTSSRHLHRLQPPSSSSSTSTSSSTTTTTTIAVSSSPNPFHTSPSDDITTPPTINAITIPTAITKSNFKSKSKSTQQRPPSWEALERRTWVEANDVRYFSWTRSEGVHYDADVGRYRSNISALLLVNRQIHGEVKELIRSVYYRLSPANDESVVVSRGCVDNEDGDDRQRCDADYAVPVPNGNFTKHPVNYRLDIYISPTGVWRLNWTHVPVKKACVENLHISFKGFQCAMAADLISQTSMLRERNSSREPPSSGWMLWSLLERYLKVGICAPHGSGLILTTRAHRNSRNTTSTTSDEKQENPKHKNYEGILDDAGGGTVADADAVADPRDDDEYAWCANTNVEYSIKMLTIDVDTKTIINDKEAKDDNCISDSPTNEAEQLSFLEQVRRMAMRPLHSVPPLPTGLESSSQSSGNTSAVAGADLARLLFFNITTILKLALYDYCDKSVFYERIQKIRLCCDGVVVTEWDLGHLLQSAAKRGEFFTAELSPRAIMLLRSMRHIRPQWLTEVIKARRRRGFTVPDE